MKKYKDHPTAFIQVDENFMNGYVEIHGSVVLTKLDGKVHVGTLLCLIN